MTQPKPETMSDDDLMEEIVETVRAARSFGKWDRTRLRAISSEAQKRGLIEPKKASELNQP